MLWIGTTSGLAYLASGVIHIPRDVPQSLHERGLWSCRRHKWVALGCDVESCLRVKRDRLLSGAIGEGDVREYGTADGLSGVEGVKRQRSVVADSLGASGFL